MADVPERVRPNAVFGKGVNVWDVSALPEQTAPSSRAGVMRGSDEDVWTTQATGDYDPDEFYIRSTNKHDHRIQQRVSFPPAIQAAVQEVVRSGEWPVYRNTHDFVRDSVVHRLHYLKARGWQNPVVEELLHVERAQGILETAKVLDMKRRELVEDAIETINRLKLSGDTDMLDATLEQLDHVADSLSAPWDEKLREVVRRNR